MSAAVGSSANSAMIIAPAPVKSPAKKITAGEPTLKLTAVVKPGLPA